MIPLNLHSIHLGGATAFFLAYLAILKLLLFSFDAGRPLSPPPPSLLHFVSIALDLLPINLRQRPKKPSNNGFTMTKLVPNKAALWALKALVLCLVIHARKDYREYLNPYICVPSIVLDASIPCSVVLEIGYALSVALPAAMFGFEFEPHFNDPFLPTSLQDLWGRRWNLVVSNTLGPLIHNPVKRISTGKAAAATGKPPAAALIFLPVMASFGISALMHELLFYYVTRARPSGEMMRFYLLHGLSLGMELKVKKALVAPVVSGILTVSFLIVTNYWLFYPHLELGRMQGL